MTRHKRILIVDDDEGSRVLTAAMVQTLGHEVELACDGLEALAKLPLNIDLVLLDIMMPNMDDFEVTRRIRADPCGADVPIIVVTGLTSTKDRVDALEAGANDFVAKPFDHTELSARMTSLLRMKEAQDSLKQQRADLEELVQRRTLTLREALAETADAHRSTQRAQLDTIDRLAMAAEYKDTHTARHIKRMSRYAAVVARGLERPPSEVDLILHACRLHDVGKLAIPDAILLKSGPLNEEEWVVMRQHTVIGERILAGSASKLLQAGQLIARSHHEWWNGSGYPDRLQGETTPLWARICAVADVFDAMTSERPYKLAMPNDRAYEILRQERGSHFDPTVLDAFFERLDEITIVQQEDQDLVETGKS